MNRFIAAIIVSIFPFASIAQTPDTVFLEDLTWTEVRHAIDSGVTTVIVPTAGTEQNGPHMVLGKHKYRMNAGAERIARELGNTLVAPIMTYVPEGEIDPPEGHMRFAGTISIPQDVFRDVVEYTARSLQAHGFKDILLIGDSGPNQSGMQAVAEALTQEWDPEQTRIFYISDWYRSDGFRDKLRSLGYTDPQIGTHAGLADTSTLMYVAPDHVRPELMAPGQDGDGSGVYGDPTQATVEIGKIGFEMSVDAAMSQIKQLMAK